MSKERQKYKIAGPATWELIRAAYLAGESAPALAERFGVSAHAIRKRITVEKWTKRDYAAALEARGLSPPPKRAPLNVAERFAAHYVPPPAPAEPVHPFAELVAALKEASAVAEGARERADEAVGAQAPSDATELERRALAQAAAAMAKGKASDAKAFAAIADQMRKRAEEDQAAEAAEVEAVQASAEDQEKRICIMFERAAAVAYAMLHHPSSAPGIFIEMVKRWREINLGEGEADAQKRAEAIARSAARWFDGTYHESMPEYWREHAAREWSEMRRRMETYGPHYASVVMMDGKVL